MDYVRIGTIYYKQVRKPLASGDLAAVLMPWSVECIRQDHGKTFLSAIPKFDGFCLMPAHLNYQRVVGIFYNRYHPFGHEPQVGYPKHTLVFLNHVFGEQLQLGLDYLKILLLYPTQMLRLPTAFAALRRAGRLRPDN